MVLFSNIEMGIGLFASSLPAVRRFYRSTIKQSHSLSSEDKSNSHQLPTISGTGGRYVKGSAARRGHNESIVRAGGSKGEGYSPGDWERLTDEGSDKGIILNAQYPNRDFDHGKGQIRVNQTFEVAYSRSPDDRS